MSTICIAEMAIICFRKLQSLQFRTFTGDNSLLSAASRTRHLGTFLSQIQHLFEGGTYSRRSKYVMYESNVSGLLMIKPILTPNDTLEPFYIKPLTKRFQ